MMVASTPVMTASRGLCSLGFWKNGTASNTVMVMMIVPPKGARGEFSLVKNRMMGELLGKKKGRMRDKAVKIIIETTAMMSVDKLA